MYVILWDLLPILDSTRVQHVFNQMFRGEQWSRGRALDPIEGTVVQSHLPVFMPGEVKDPTQGVNV